MGESPATYEHADAVATLTARIRAEHPDALSWASEPAAAIVAATTFQDPAVLTLLVNAHHHLSAVLTEEPDPQRLADDILTAAIHLASGIDYAAVAVQVRHLDGYRYSVTTYDGTVRTITPYTHPTMHTGQNEGGAASKTT